MQDILMILLGISLLYVFAASRIEAYIKTLSIQGFLLFGLVLLDLHSVSGLNLILLVLETLAVKAVFIPLFLLRVIRRNEIRHEVEPTLPQFYATLMATLLFLFGFIVAFWASRTISDIRPLYFGMSIAIIMASLLLIVTRKRIISHILGYMLLENGIFLLSLSIANEMPLLVNLGILLDLFVAVFLLSIFLNKIRLMFDGDHIDALTQLKD
jgi:hydrogenase-4 component E